MRYPSALLPDCRGDPTGGRPHPGLFKECDMMNEDKELVVQEPQRFDLSRTDGVAALKQAESMVKYLAAKCDGPKYISHISGKKYPKVEWWTTVGAGLGLFPQEESCVRLDRDEEMAYEAIVTVRRGGEVVSRGSAMCSNKERSWRTRDEYAIRSMAVTRAVGKAYRIAFSFLAVMADLEPTPAEEMVEEYEARKVQGSTQARDDNRQVIIEQIAQVVGEFTDERKDVYRRRITAAGNIGELKRVLEQAQGEWKAKDGAERDAADEPDPVVEAGWDSTDGGTK